MFSTIRSLVVISVLLFCVVGAYSQETSSNFVKSNSEFRIDRFGQLATYDWPEKVHDEKDLIQDANDDEAYYKSIALPERDMYGGYLGTKEKFGLNGTGFSHIEKIMFENRTPFSTPKFKAAFRYGRKDFGTNNWRLIQVGQNKETVDVKGGEEE